MDENDPIENKQAILSRIYLQINEGSLFAPNIEYVEFTGINPESGTRIGREKKDLILGVHRSVFPYT